MSSEMIKQKPLLTFREAEILETIKSGITSTKEIGSELHLKNQTVKNHLTNAYHALKIPGGRGSDKKIKALAIAISLNEIEPFKPSINEENTTIFQLGAFHFIINALTKIYSTTIE